MHNFLLTRMLIKDYNKIWYSAQSYARPFRFLARRLLEEGPAALMVYGVRYVFKFGESVSLQKSLRSSLYNILLR